MRTPTLIFVFLAAVHAITTTSVPQAIDSITPARATGLARREPGALVKRQRHQFYLLISPNPEANRGNVPKRVSRSTSCPAAGGGPGQKRS